MWTPPEPTRKSRFENGPRYLEDQTTSPIHRSGCQRHSSASMTGTYPSRHQQMLSKQRRHVRWHQPPRRHSKRERRQTRRRADITKTRKIYKETIRVQKRVQEQGTMFGYRRNEHEMTRRFFELVKTSGEPVFSSFSWTSHRSR